MMRSLLSTLLIIGCLWTVPKSDFSGIWFLDGDRSAEKGVYGQVRIVAQTATEVNMTAIHYLGYTRRYDILPWAFRLNRWGPRRPPSDQPITRGGWDGETFLAAKSAGQDYSVLWKWHLLRPDVLAIDAINWTNLPESFNFREASIPKYYVPDTFIYRKIAPEQFPSPYFVIHPRTVSWEKEPVKDDVTFALLANATQLKIFCGSAGCKILDLEGDSWRQMGRGEAFTIPLPSRWAVQPN